jgi:predicted nucleic acid-binding protein
MRAFQQATPRRAFCAVHSIAEVYAVMTRLPVRPSISPEQGVLFLESLRERVSFVGLDGDEYFSVIQRAASHHLTGGRIYDALICGCARKISPAVIFTWNVRHFKEFAADLADRIRTP